MKYNFPEGVYTDVRIEHVFKTTISYLMRELQECKEQKYSAAFIRVYDGEMWYYASTSDLEGIQAEINELALIAKKNPNIKDAKIFKNFSANKDEVMAFIGREVWAVPLDDKINLLQGAMPYLEENEYIKMWRLAYLDSNIVKEFYNSKGADLRFDYQRAGFSTSFTMIDGENKMEGRYSKPAIAFPDLNAYADELKEEIAECQKFLLESEPV
ncbi:MAG: hypothetical protein FWE83_05535 [Oscillospiraceae bacterium]|nr:hypothetical protein [Oscillospiraceae bacterium]